MKIIRIAPILMFLSNTGLSGGYYYSSMKKNDPFLQVPIRKETPSPSTSPLEQSDIKTFRLVGVIVSPGNILALLNVNGTKSAFTARTGDRIGIHGGKIISISKDKIMIKELINLPTGQQKMLEHVLSLNSGGSPKESASFNYSNLQNIQPPRGAGMEHGLLTEEGKTYSAGTGISGMQTITSDTNQNVNSSKINSNPSQIQNMSNQQMLSTPGGTEMQPSQPFPRPGN